MTKWGVQSVDALNLKIQFDIQPICGHRQRLRFVKCPDGAIAEIFEHGL